jgi:hypothetical protein
VFITILTLAFFTPQNRPVNTPDQRERVCLNCRFYDRPSKECRRSFPRLADGRAAVWLRTDDQHWCGAWGAIKQLRVARAPKPSGRPMKYPPSTLLPVIQRLAPTTDRSIGLTELHRQIQPSVPIERSALFYALGRMVRAGQIVKDGHYYYAPAALEVE